MYFLLDLSMSIYLWQVLCIFLTLIYPRAYRQMRSTVERDCLEEAYSLAKRIWVGNWKLKRIPLHNILCALNTATDFCMRFQGRKRFFFQRELKTFISSHRNIIYGNCYFSVDVYCGVQKF